MLFGFDDIVATVPTVTVFNMVVAHRGYHLVVLHLILVVMMVIMMIVVMVTGGGGPPSSYRHQYVRAGHAAVHTHVPVQVAGLREPQQAQLTLVRFFTRVYP